MKALEGLRSSTPAPVRSWAKIVRARTAEAVGSDRWQLPGLHDLDRQMLERLPEMGTFLEIGGNDGYTVSNTYYLERHRGWSGILIEPLPWAYRICRRHRTRAETFNVACVGPNDPPSVTLVDRGPMAVCLGLMDRTEETRRVGGVRRTVEVHTATISSVIDQSSIDRITFMVIDVEGAELHVLAGLDLDRHTPDFLLIETDHLEAVESALDGHMVMSAALSHHDYLFVTPSRAAGTASSRADGAQSDQR